MSKDDQTTETPKKTWGVIDFAGVGWGLYSSPEEAEETAQYLSDRERPAHVVRIP